MTRRRVALVATVLCGVLAAGAVAATSAAWSNPAHARGALTSGTWSWYGQVRLAGTQQCLDVASRENNDGTAVQLYACNSTPAQIWTFGTDESIQVYEATGQWAANDNPTPRCLDIPGQSNANNLAMQIWSCVVNGAGAVTQTNQRWYLTFNDTAGTVQIRSRAAGTGATVRCLDVPSTTLTQGTAVRVNNCASTGRSRDWVLERVNPVLY